MTTARMDWNELNDGLSEEEERELEAARRLPPLYDEDSPQMMPKMLAGFKRFGREGRNKQAVSLGLSPGTLKIARMYGKGYTSFLV